MTVPTSTVFPLDAGDTLLDQRRRRGGSSSAPEHELVDRDRRHPADHYVIVDDELRILDAIKRGC